MGLPIGEFGRQWGNSKPRPSIPNAKTFSSWLPSAMVEQQNSAHTRSVFRKLGDHSDYFTERFTQFKIAIGFLMRVTKHRLSWQFKDYVRLQYQSDSLSAASTNWIFIFTLIQCRTLKWLGCQGAL